MVIKTIVVSPYQQNARVLIDESEHLAMVIDPGDNAEELFRACEPDKNKIQAIILTHGHIDHASAVAPLLNLIKGTKPLLYYHLK